MGLPYNYELALLAFWVLINKYPTFYYKPKRRNEDEKVYC